MTMNSAATMPSSEMTSGRRPMATSAAQWER